MVFTGPWSSNCVCDTTGSGTVDCLGIPNGPNVPGSPCTNPATGLEGFWAADCSCTPGTNPDCEAGFFVMQAYQWVDSIANPNGGGGEPIPNELWVWNLSNGGTGIFQFVWSFGDGTSSSEAFPSHTYASSGTYELCLTITDNEGCTDTYCQSITVDGDGMLGGFMGEGNRSTFTIHVMDPLSTGMTELPVYSNLTTWPNPVNEVLNVTLDSRLQGGVRIAITDLSGRVVSNSSRSINAGRNILTVPVTDLGAGLYLITIDNGSSTVSNRFVKVR